jgi:hypothetical protein
MRPNADSWSAAAHRFLEADVTDSLEAARSNVAKSAPTPACPADLATKDQEGGLGEAGDLVYLSEAQRAVS